MNKETAVQPMEPEQKPLGSVWVDCDDQLLCLGMEQVLEAQANVYCGREAPAGDDPSFVICPYGGDVVSELKRIRNLVPDVPILVFGPHDDLPLARVALREGAQGFIHGGMPPKQIIDVLRTVRDDVAVIPRKLLKGLVTEESEAEPSTFTPRQLEILKLVAEGLTSLTRGS